jgi:hypothetical protein
MTGRGDRGDPLGRLHYHQRGDISTVNRRSSHPELRPWHLAGHMVSRGVALVPLGGGTLALGMAMYHWVEGLAWPDAFLNAAMLLGGMGPVDPLRTTAGKWLAGL